MTTSRATLQEQAKALGDPTRHAVFRYVADADHPVGVAELTDRFAVNHNAIRQHLAKLLRAGLLVEERVPTGGRGRPRLEYRVDPAADGRWGVVGPYERLSTLLAEVTRTGEPPVEVGRSSVHPAELTGDGRDPVARVVDAMAKQGFAPEVVEHDEQVEVVLTECPFAAAAEVDPETVCALHLGIAQGVADATDGQVVVEELVARDPRRAECRLVLRVDPDGVTPLR